MYERYCQLRDLTGVKDADIAKITEIPKSTFSDWKSGKSVPKPDKLSKIADYFNVSIDFLMEKADTVCCPKCSINYNPLDEDQNLTHQRLHAAYERAIIKYGICFTLDECREIDAHTVNILTGSSASYIPAKDLEINYTNHLKSDFSYLLRKNGFVLDYESFDEYAREKIIKERHQNFMTKDLFDLLVKKYDVDLSYIDENAETLAFASNSAQLMRILNYAKHINPQMLDAIEIQLKALAEQNDKE